MTASSPTPSSAAAAGRPRCSPGWRPPMRDSAAGSLADLAELLARVTERETLEEAPGKSGARIERVVIDGQRYVLKHMDPGSDWTIRASGSLRGASLTLWERGILARLPDCLNQPILAVAGEGTDGRGVRPRRPP